MSGFICLICKKNKDESEAKRINKETIIDGKKIKFESGVPICEECMSQTEFDTVFSYLRTKELCNVGKNNNLKIEPNSKLAEQFQKGIEIEKEHSDDLIIRGSISKDHIAEIEDYYDRLEVIEWPEFWSLINRRKYNSLIKEKQKQKQK